MAKNGCGSFRIVAHFRGNTSNDDSCSLVLPQVSGSTMARHQLAPPVLWTRRQAAQYFGVNIITVDRWIARGILRPASDDSGAFLNQTSSLWSRTELSQQQLAARVPLASERVILQTSAVHKKRNPPNDTSSRGPERIIQRSARHGEAKQTTRSTEPKCYAKRNSRS